MSRSKKIAELFCARREDQNVLKGIAPQIIERLRPKFYNIILTFPESAFFALLRCVPA
jgi:hypothetical protein